MSAKISLSSRRCFIRTELVINFPDSQSAIEYQRANPEGRIFALAPNEVYLPRPQGLISIRSSSQTDFSIVLEFASEKETRAWHGKMLLTSIFLDHVKTRAYLLREVRPEKFMGRHMVGAVCYFIANSMMAYGTKYEDS